MDGSYCFNKRPDSSPEKNIEYYCQLLRELKRSELEVYRERLAEDNYHSNAIEGSRVTYQETLEILAGKGDTITKYAPIFSKNLIVTPTL